jgi:glycosyltransferase involved in cell wall biosynthesis
MKVIIQIPCFNEEETLGITLDALPRTLPGVDEVEYLIIDDGSTDRTVEVAKAHGVHHVTSFTYNRGLAAAFMRGLRVAVDQGADIVVNTDADNQYCADDIEKLIAPILSGKAGIVVGARPIQDHPHFSGLKKLLQRLGSYMVRLASNTDIPDAPSGFRAISRDAAQQLNVFNKYTYTLETIIQAGHKGIPITSVPIRVNGDLRPSRLVKSIPSYIYRSVVVIFRIFVVSHLLWAGQRAGDDSIADFCFAPHEPGLSPVHGSPARGFDLGKPPTFRKDGLASTPVGNPPG